MSTSTLIDAVLAKVPNADPSAILDLIVACDANLDKVFTLLGVQSNSKKRQMTFDGCTSKRPAKVTKTSADTVSLFTSEQVKDADIHCALIRNVLPSEVANNLAVKLEKESAAWKHRSFYLFERQVTSGHKTALYTDDELYLKGDRETSYQGRTIGPDEIFEFPTEMRTGRDIIERIVQDYTKGWKSSVVLVNRYGTRSEKLDFHSDQLTYLGPKPTIAALSLGCTREFRLKDRSVPPQRPSYSIQIPHNSLLIMFGECQERFKHCVPPVKSVDPDPLLGTSRISLTFRMYRPELNDKTLPRCHCDAPMLLRSTIPDRSGRYKYIWQCAQHYNGGEGCDKTQLYTELNTSKR